MVQQVIVCNGFEPCMHEGWCSRSDLEPGQVKHLGLAGNYRHVNCRALSWQPIPAGQAVRVDVKKVGSTVI